MDEQLYQQVLLAVEVSHSPLAAPADRKAAYAFCEEFKNRPDCALYSVAIYKNPTLGGGVHAAPVTSLQVHTRQHFALHVLEHYVLTKWSALPVPDQAALRTELVDLLLRDLSTGTTSPALTGPASATEEPVFLKEKKVALVAAIAKRQFPQRWPEFLPEILSIWQTGSAKQVELVLMILRSLAEDCVSSNFNTSIPPARRKDILQGLNACLPQLFPVMYQELEKQYAQYQSPAVSPAEKQSSKKLIHAALQMLKEFLDWLPIEKPVDPSTNFIYVAVLLLGDSEFRLAAAECLEVYMSRSFGKENRKIMLESTSLIVEKISALDLEDLVSDLEANLRFHRKINDILVMWGANQLDTLLLDSPQQQEMGLLHAILQNLCRLFAHPSLIITEAQIVLWLNILKNKTILKQGEAYLGEILAKLRQVSFEKYFRLGSPDRDDDGVNIVCQTSAEEFDDHHEYMAFFGNFRGRLYALVRVLVQLNPTVALQMLLERATFVLTQYTAGSDHLTADRGLCTELSTEFLYHEGISSLIDCVVKQLPQSALENPANQQLLHALLERILAFESQDPLLKFRQMFVLSAFSKYYVLDGNVLTQVFEILFGNINFLLPGEDVHGHMNNDTIVVRRRALASLVSICQAIPAHILPVLPVLCTKVQELFAADLVLDSEGVLLYEMLVLVSNSMENAEERAQFVQQIVQEPLSRWTAPEMTALVSSPENIVSAIESAASNPETRKMLFKVVKTLTTLYGIAKRAGSESFGLTWPHLLPNLMALMRSIHALYEPAIKDAVLKTSTACWLLSLSVDEIAQLLGGKHQLEEEEVAKLPAESKWSKWHKNVRDVTYHVVGLALNQKSFYSNPQVMSFFQNSILSNLEVMEHRHIKNQLAYVFLPFLKSCPQELYPTLLDPVLSHIFGHLVQRFSSCFVKASSSLADGDYALNKTKKTPWSALIVGVEEAKHDVAQEKMLMDLARQVMEFLEFAIDAKTVVGGDTDNPKHVMNPEDEYQRDFILLQSGSLPFSIGALLVQIIGWKDTMSCRKAALLGEKLVNMLHSDPKFNAMLGRDVFSVSLEALLYEHVGHVKEDGLKWELINLARNIYCRLALGLVPVEECKGIDPCNQPLRPASSLCMLPREILLSLPDVALAQVEALDVFLREKHSMKTQKNAFKEFLEVPMLAIRQQKALASGSASPLAAAALGSGDSTKQIQDLPEKLVIQAKEYEAAAKLYETHNADIDANSLFGL
ncbi:Exportin-5-like protein [Globisporangium polare]